MGARHQFNKWEMDYESGEILPTKEDLLNAKTTDELKRMARDKEISGYTNMKKIELIGAIDDNYNLNEIKVWKTKQELLNTKGVDELRDMAKEKDIPYVPIRDKSELIDTIRNNYSLDEIIKWGEPDLITIFVLVISLTLVAIIIAILFIFG